MDALSAILLIALLLGLVGILAALVGEDSRDDFGGNPNRYWRDHPSPPRFR